MKRNSDIGRAVFLSVVVLAAAAFASEAQNAAQGTLTVGEGTVEIQHAYVDDRDEFILVMLTDIPVSEDNQIYGAWSLAEEGKTAGLVFSFKKTDRALTHHFDSLFHKAFDGRPGKIGDGAQLDVSRFDDEVLEGRLHLDEPAERLGLSYSYDITFSVAYGAEKELVPMEATITGDDSPPAKGYASFVKALMALDLDETRKWTAKERAAVLDEEDVMEMLDMVRSMHPQEIRIVGTETSGETATLTLEGTLDGSPGTGTVTMAMEDGLWKVQNEDWKFKE